MGRHILRYGLLLTWMASIVILYRLHYEGAISKGLFDAIIAIVILGPLAVLLAWAGRRERKRKSRPRGG